MKLRLASLAAAALFAALALAACGGDAAPDGIGATASATAAPSLIATGTSGP